MVGHRFSGACVIALIAAAALPSSAAAQTFRPAEIFGGYAFAHDAKNDISLPAGWLAGGAIGINEWLSAVVDVTGLGAAFGFTETTNAFALQPGGGIDYPLTARFAARGQLDVRFIRNEPNGNEGGNEYRFSAALVY